MSEGVLKRMPSPDIDNFISNYQEHDNDTSSWSWAERRSEDLLVSRHTPRAKRSSDPGCKSHVLGIVPESLIVLLSLIIRIR